MSEGLFVGPVAGLVAQDLGKPGTFGDARLYRRVGILLVLAHLALCLPLDVPCRTVIEVPPPVLRHDRALPLRTFGPDLLREPAHLGFIVPACDPVPPLLERRSPLRPTRQFPGLAADFSRTRRGPCFSWHGGYGRG